MLDPKLIPTPLVRTEERPKIEIVELKKPSDHWVLQFLRIVLRWACRVAWAFLRRRLTHAEYARLFRTLLEELGGLWIKAGQLLSLRVDMFSTEFCTELTKLQHRAEGFPTPEAIKIIEESLGATIDTVFTDFSGAPFATASIGQIYRARLKHEGIWVAIKVQRPYLAERFERDLALIGWVVGILKGVPVLRFLRWNEAYWELKEIMHEELDYRYEASAMRRMKKTLRAHNIYVPKVFSRHTSQRILVTEFIHAGLMSDFISLYRTEPSRLSQWLTENNIDPKLVARRLIMSVFRQLFEDNLYHGDLHPGNIILLRDSRVAFIDMGSIGFTEAEFLERLRIFTKALAMRDFAKVADMQFLLVSTLPPNVELDEMKSELIRTLRSWAARTFVKELPYHEKSMDNALVEASRLLFQYRITIEWAFLRIRRVLTTLDSALIYLYSDINYTRLIENYFIAAERRSFRKSVRNLPAQAVHSMSTAFDLQQHANEYLFHQSAIIRRQAQVFEGTTSKFSYFLRVLFGQAAILEFLVGVMLLMGFLHQHHPTLVQPWLGSQVQSVVGWFPKLDAQVWVLLLLVDAYLFETAARLRKKFAERDRGTS